MPKLEKLLDCDHRIHCNTCRDLEGGRMWRMSLKRITGIPEVDFDCPYGYKWGDKPVSKPIPEKLCRFLGEVVGPPPKKGHCKGPQVKCLNPRTPVDTWWKNWCNHRKCRFFEPKGVQ